MAPVSPRRPAPRLVGGELVVAALVVASLVLAVPLPAAAAPSMPAFPGADDVGRSRAAQARTADAVGRIEARLAAVVLRADRLAVAAGRAIEAYNGARVRLGDAERRATAAQQEARRARMAVQVARASLGRFAAAAYRAGGDIGGLSAFLDADGPRDLISRAAALQAVGTSRRHALGDVRSAQVHAELLELRASRLVAAREHAARDVGRAKDRAASRLDAQRRLVTGAAATRSRLIRSLAAARNTTVGLERARQDGLDRQRAEAARRAARAQAKAARAAAVRAEQRAAAERQAAEDRAAAERQAVEDRAAADRAAADRAAADRVAEPERGPAGGTTKPASPSPSPSPPPAPPTPPPGSGAAAPAGSSSGSRTGAERAVAFARAQIGKAYEWAADGPDSYDCSGLTLRAWEQGGVALPHYSVAQYERSAKVPIADIRPGDLVFYASDGNDHRTIYHVGLAIGGGQMIEAPYTGENVRVSSIWRSSLFGAARP